MPGGFLMPTRHAWSVVTTVFAAIILPSPTILPDLGQAGAAELGSGDGELSILPRSSTLAGRRATAQLVATERSLQGTVADRSRSVEWISSNPAVALVTPKGRVIPKGNGTATIV